MHTRHRRPLTRHTRTVGCAVACAVVLAALLWTPAALAQHMQICADLNDPALASEYLAVYDKTGLEGNANYTIEAWVRPIAGGVNQAIVGNDFSQSFYLGLGPGERVRFYPKGGSNQYFESNASVPLGIWTHVAATYSSVAGAKIYVNGELDAADASYTGMPGTSPNPLYVGADRQSPTSPAYFWRGMLGEIRIWSETRTATQIHDHYRIGVGSRAVFTNTVYEHLEACWAFAAGVEPTTQDNADGLLPGANLLFQENGAGLAYDEGPPVSVNTALELNGVDDHAMIPMADGFPGGLTIDAWVRPDDFSNYSTIVGRDYHTSFWLGFAPDGRVRFYPTGGTGNYFESQTSLSVTHWMHVAATYRPGDARIYINGKLDTHTDSFTAPVGGNGRDVWIGADNEGGAGVPYPFQGALDNVRICKGVWSVAQIRERMFLGFEWAGEIPSHEFVDDEGIARDSYAVGFGEGEFVEYSNYGYAVSGTDAHLVRSGAPLVEKRLYWAMGIADPGLENYLMKEGSTPEIASAILSPLWYEPSQTIGTVRIFVSAPMYDLSSNTVNIKSPSGTMVRLLDVGETTGSDLHTVFYDAAPWTLATGFAPFYDGVQPSQSLSAVAGEDSHGYWTLSLGGDAVAKVGRWYWGIEINGVNAGVDQALPERVELANAGGNPVRGQGRVSFTLPRAASVDLRLFDLQGRPVRTLLDGPQAPGTFMLSWSAADLPAGAYFVRLRVDGEPAGSLRITVLR